MPAEQEVRVIANDAVEHDGWLDPVDMMRLARAYLALEAELLAAREAGDNALFDIGKLREQLLAAQERAEKAEYDALMANKVVEANSVARWQSVETKKAQRVEAELAVAQERADKLSKLIVEQEADYREREKALREALERIRDATFAGKWMQQVAGEALAGSPSEKPDG